VSRSVVPSTTAKTERAEPRGQGAKGRGPEQKASSGAGAAGGRPEAPPGRTKPSPSFGRGHAKPVKAKATGNGRAVGHDRPKAKGRGGAQEPPRKGSPPGKGKKTSPVPDVPAPTKPKK
jgi:hypothetical protein